jgi:hypothetical protein
MIINGLPPGTTLVIRALHHRFICNNGAPLADCTSPGGSLGGSIEQFDSTLHLDITGTGALQNFQRVIDIPAPVEIHTAPVILGAPLQNFDTEIVSLSGIAPPDPDFALLTLIAGVNENPGLGSSGETMLKKKGGSFEVNSFFDVTYEISFVGEAGGALDGLSGTTIGTVRMGTGVAEVPMLSNWALLTLEMLLVIGGVALKRRRGRAA